MGLIRFIILALVIWLVWRLFQIQKRKSARSKRQTSFDNRRNNETMVKCEICGTHLPPRNALRHERLWFCSQQHLEQHQSGNGQS